MAYTRSLPREDSLTHLVDGIIFPATRDELIIAARFRGASTTMIHFLKLFSIADTFANRLDFLNQAFALEMALRRATSRGSRQGLRPSNQTYPGK